MAALRPAAGGRPGISRADQIAIHQDVAVVNAGILTAVQAVHALGNLNVQFVDLQNYVTRGGATICETPSGVNTSRASFPSGR
jgi:hypothetical protein